MSSLPHNYAVTVSAEADSSVSISSEGLPDFNVMPPSQFGGPGDQWSPEDLLMASLASCLVLSFRAVASASRLEWQNLNVACTGQLDKVDRVVKFTQVDITAELTVLSADDLEKGKKLLEKAEATCFISNTLTAEIHLSPRVSSL